MSPGGLAPAAAACVFPGFVGLERAGLGATRGRGGYGGVVLFARNVRDPEQVRALPRRSEKPGLLIAVDEEGGDVTRLEAAQGARSRGTSRSVRSTTWR